MRIITALFLVSLLASCNTVGRKIDTDYVGLIVKGQTTANEVVSNMGKPMTVTKNHDGSKVMVYMYSVSNIKGETFIPVVGLFAGGSTSDVQMLQLMVDSKGVVTDYRMTETHTNLTNGSSG